MLDLPKVQKNQEDILNQDERKLGQSKSVLLNVMALLLVLGLTQSQANAQTNGTQINVGHNLQLLNSVLEGDVNRGHYSHMSHRSHYSHYSGW